MVFEMVSSFFSGYYFMKNWHIITRGVSWKFQVFNNLSVPVGFFAFSDQYFTATAASKMDVVVSNFFLLIFTWFVSSELVKFFSLIVSPT